MNTDHDRDRSIKRVTDREYHVVDTTGFGTGKQAQPLIRRYQEQLADRIRADRSLGHRDKDVWRALRGHDDDTLALRLLTAGTSVCYSDKLGADEDGEKNFRDITLWIGRNLGIGRKYIRQLQLVVKVGAWGALMLTTLPVFTFEGDRILTLTLTADIDELMNEAIIRAYKSNPYLSPFATPPEPWTQVRKGVLPVDHWAHVPLIREHHHTIEDAARYAIGRGQMQRVLDAINSLQAVAYTINEPVLNFMRRMAAPSDPGPKPPIWQESNFKRWQKRYAEFRAFHTDMVVAEAMADYERFYVPLNIDFRGRLYGVPHFNFTREDHVRGLFLFADGKPIGEEGLGWLRIHVAACADGNTWSEVQKPSKLHPHDMQSWTRDNLQILRTIGEAVLRGDDPAASLLPDDKPCQFIAACVELVQAIDAGPDFPTRLPLTFDASCSGLQHLCAITRADEGCYVNLVARREADDFYRRVAERVFEVAPPGVMTGPDDRKIVKQPVMSYFYGSVPGNFARPKWGGRSRPFGMTKQVIDVLKERKQSAEGAQELASTIYQVVEGMVPKATAVRGFLEKLAKLCADNNEPLRWTTPLGLPVINRYHEPETEIVPVWLNGYRRRVKLVIRDKPYLDKTKAKNAVTANFIHSVDASHLQLVALAAANEGIPMVSVHDCFGTIAPCAGRLGEIIRQEFIRLHERELLNEVRESAKRDLPRDAELPSLPEKGNLSLEGLYGVLFSVHAFK
jgi:DNA-directed RNA polymerase, mitochondrial